MERPETQGVRAMETNLLLLTDSYKFSHYMQYPPGFEGMYSYLESRGGRFSETVFFGLQYQLKRYLSKPITMADVNEAAELAKAHGEPFNFDGWKYIVEKHRGYIPVRIKAVPEGEVVATHNVLVTVESTDPQVPWVVSYIETLLMNIWYPITVATQSWHIKQMIREFLNKTSDNPEAELPFKLHDFGARGVSSVESAGVGGMAHLVNFMGTDTVVALKYAREYYGAQMAGFSIPAAEHSTITMWGKENEGIAFKNMLDKYAKPGALLAVVSDSYDIYNAVSKLWGQDLRQQVIDSGATVIIRPDSGTPHEVVLECLKRLEVSFGAAINAKGYKVLNHVRVIQGDGVNHDSIRKILNVITEDGYSTSNIAFGMGGALLQKLDRDTQKFAYKCSSARINGKDVAVFKDPVTDSGKRSKRGKLSYTYMSGRYETVEGADAPGDMLRTVYENGHILIDYTLDDIRLRANQGASDKEIAARRPKVI